MHLHLSSDEELEKYLRKVMLDLISDGVKSFADEKGVSEEDATLVCGSIVLIFMGLFNFWIQGGMQPGYREKVKKALQHAQRYGGAYDRKPEKSSRIKNKIRTNSELCGNFSHSFFCVRL